MSPIRRAGRIASAVLVFLLLAVTAGPLPAQSPALRGRVVDPEGRPVSGIPVTLHRVIGTDGGEVGRAITAEDGGFTIELREVDDGGVYFAATRFDSTLYMGHPFRTLAEATDDYLIVIGEGGFAGGPAVSAPARPEAEQGWIVLLLFGLAGLGVVIVPLRRARRGSLAVRTTLTELAELEEESSNRPADGRQAAAAEYRARREALRARLRELSGAPVHAADSH